MTVTAVDHSRDHDLTVQGSQAARSWALRHLLEETSLPTIDTWTIDATLGYLHGLVFPRENPAEQRQVIEAWGAFLHMPVEESTGMDVTTVAVDGPCEYGVRVRISTQLSAAIKEVAA